MSTQISWAVEAKIKAGQRDAFNQVMANMVEAAKNEAGTIVYEWTLAPDNEHIHVYERYQDADAARVHLAAWTKVAEEFMAVVDMERVVVYSDLPEDLQQAFAGEGTVVMQPIGGFAR